MVFTSTNIFQNNDFFLTFVHSISDEHAAIYSSTPIHSQYIEHYLFCEDSMLQTTITR